MYKDTKKYRITKETYQNKTWMWDAKVEIYLSLFAERLCKIKPDLKYNVVCKEILEKYVRKRKDSKVGTTQIMRHVLNKK